MSAETCPPWLDKTFLETALGNTVKSFEAKPLGGGNENFASNLYRVNVELKMGRREHLVVKKLLDEGVDGKLMAESSMFTREIHMYTVILPKLTALLEKVIPDFQPLAPRHIYSSNGVIVMEDLSAQGFKMLDRRAGLGLDHSLLVMRTLARFHAASVILHEEEPECFQLYSDSIFSERCIEELQAPFCAGMTRLLADEVETWPEFGEKYAKMFREMSGQIVKLIVEGVQRQEGRFNVLTHDDIWVNNLMFKTVDSVRLIDFQQPHFASPGNDLQMVLIMSMTNDMQKDHSSTLLEAYHKSLCDTLTALGYKKKLITMKELLEENKKSARYAFVINAVFFPCCLAGPDYVIPMFRTDGPPPDRSIYDDSRVREMFKFLLKSFEHQGAFSINS